MSANNNNTSKLLNSLPAECLVLILKKLPLSHLLQLRTVCKLWLKLIESDLLRLQKSLVLELCEENLWKKLRPCGDFFQFASDYLTQVNQKDEDNAKLLKTSTLTASIVNTLTTTFPRLHTLTIIVGKISSNRDDVFLQCVCLLSSYAPKLTTLQLVLTNTFPEEHFLEMLKVINSIMPKLKRLAIFAHHRLPSPPVDKEQFKLPILVQLEQLDFYWPQANTQLLENWKPLLKARCEAAISADSNSTRPPVKINLHIKASTNILQCSEVASTLNMFNVRFSELPFLRTFCETYCNLTALMIITSSIPYKVLIEQLAKLKGLTKLAIGLFDGPPPCAEKAFIAVSNDSQLQQSPFTALPTIKRLYVYSRNVIISHCIISRWQLKTVFPNATLVKINFHTENLSCFSCDWSMDKLFAERKCFFAEHQQKEDQLSTFPVFELTLEHTQKKVALDFVKAQGDQYLKLHAIFKDGKKTVI